MLSYKHFPSKLEIRFKVHFSFGKWNILMLQVSYLRAKPHLNPEDKFCGLAWVSWVQGTGRAEQRWRQIKANFYSLIMEVVYEPSYQNKPASKTHGTCLRLP